MGCPNCPTQQGEQRQYIEGNSAIDGQTEAVNKHSVEECAEADCSWDDNEHHCEKHDTGSDQCFHDAPFGKRIFFEIVDEYDCRDDQQVEQVHADSETS